MKTDPALTAPPLTPEAAAKIRPLLNLRRRIHTGPFVPMDIRSRKAAAGG